MPSQKDAGKAFEFALIYVAYEILSKRFHVKIVEDSTYANAEKSFDLFNENQKQGYRNAAKLAINHILSLEPKLQDAKAESDILTLTLQSDIEGQKGDVRDVLFIRSLQNWEIGVSAKNNHKAVKHSRLSAIKDFGLSWVNIPCSENYFNSIQPIFTRLKELKVKKELWRNIPNKATDIYVPILEAFRNELLNINLKNENVPQALIHYLLGNNDFYKVIKGRRHVEVLAFNIKGSLNLGTTNKPLREIQKLKMPTRIIEFVFKDSSTDTLILTCDEGWQISFRIHNAESKVVPSLKFDINLIGHPQSLYTHHLKY